MNLPATGSHRKLYTILPSQENADKVVAYPNRDRNRQVREHGAQIPRKLREKKTFQGGNLRDQYFGW